jgi:archaellum component FlaG (FlaF/FlaG flagellin family)
MYTKLTALVLVAALAAVLITSTLAISDDADAKRKSKSQSIFQKNNCFSNCQNTASQIQGSGNLAIVISSQR